MGRPSFSYRSVYFGRGVGIALNAADWARSGCARRARVVRRAICLEGGPCFNRLKPSEAPLARRNTVEGTEGYFSAARAHGKSSQRQRFAWGATRLLKVVNAFQRSQRRRMRVWKMHRRCAALPTRGFSWTTSALKTARRMPRRQECWQSWQHALVCQYTRSLLLHCFLALAGACPAA